MNALQFCEILFVSNPGWKSNSHVMLDFQLFKICIWF
uniref:Uncharacterized protein n=1 Tax=Arundo donax TaxID=35708 RepID=A0A0A9BLR2_ARUDO